MAGLQDITLTLMSPINFIRFDRFILPETFRVISEGQPRRQTKTAIQNRDGELQQDTYESIKMISIEGSVYANQGMKDGSPLSLTQLVGEIRSSLTTRDDRRLFLENGFYYDARLANSQLAYTPDANREVGTLSLEFVVSKPYLYSSERVTGEETGIGLSEREVTFNNEGGIDAFLQVEIEIVTATASVRINFYNPSRVTILDSPGALGTDNSRYYQPGDKIVFDSEGVDLRWIPASGDESLIFHHVRPPVSQTSTPIQQLPFLLPVGESKLGFRVIGDGRYNVSFLHQSRWH